MLVVVSVSKVGELILTESEAVRGTSLTELATACVEEEIDGRTLEVHSFLLRQGQPDR